MRYTPPPEAQQIHDRLVQLGVVERIMELSVPGDEGHLCWVVEERAGTQVTLKVVAHFTRLRGPRREPSEAEFGVSLQAPFGPMGSVRLTSSQVAGVQGIVASYHTRTS